MGIASPSLVHQLLEDPPENVDNLEDRIKGAAGAMYGGMYGHSPIAV